MQDAVERLLSFMYALQEGAWTIVKADSGLMACLDYSVIVVKGLLGPL